MSKRTGRDGAQSPKKASDEARKLSDAELESATGGGDALRTSTTTQSEEFNPYITVDYLESAPPTRKPRDEAS